MRRLIIASIEAAANPKQRLRCGRRASSTSTMSLWMRQSERLTPRSTIVCIDPIDAWRYRRFMKSRLAQRSEQALIEAAQRLTPEQRLAAFVTHCRLVNALQRAGEQARKSKSTPPRASA